MHAEPLVYIIVLNWNGKQVTLECLASLKIISYSNCKILVVDNASTDGSVEAIANAFPDVTILPMKKNLRFAGGNNAGIRYALDKGADMLLLLNNDTVVDPAFLSFMVARMRDTDHCGMVTPKVLYFDRPDRIWFAGGIISMWTGTMRHVGIREIDIGQHDKAGKTDYATGCCVLTQRTAIEEAGLLDESYHMYTEDADWSLRIRRASYTIMYEPRARIWHRLSVSTGGHLSWYKMKNKYVSNLRFFRRYASWYQWPVFPWLSIAVNGISALRYLFTLHR
jgi:GT2 family glycosyltransferase